MISGKDMLAAMEVVASTALLHPKGEEARRQTLLALGVDAEECQRLVARTIAQDIRSIVEGEDVHEVLMSASLTSLCLGIVLGREHPLKTTGHDNR